MSVPAHLIQGSDAWHDYRAKMGNASEASALLGVSPWFPRTPVELWQVKTSREAVTETPAMRRGSDLEAPSRAYIEAELNNVFEPAVVADGRLSASLDGITFDGKTLLEIKVPMKGRESTTWQHVVEHAAPPEHYWWQVQQQLMVSGAEKAVFVVCEEKDGAIVGHTLCEVLPDVEAYQRLRDAWAAFLPHLDDDTPPQLTDRDTVIREDAEWAAACHNLQGAKAALDAAKADYAAAEEAVKALAGDWTTEGCGVRVTRYWRRGSVDYKRLVPADADIESARKAGTWVQRVDVKAA